MFRNEETAMNNIDQVQPLSTSARRVFLCAGNDWGRHPSSLTHIFKIIARTEPVVWINSIGQRSPRLVRKDLQRLWEKGRNILLRPAYVPEEGEVEGAAPDAVIEPKVLPYHRYRWVRRFNSSVLEHQLAPFLRQRHPARQDLIFVTSNPGAVDLIGRFGAGLSVYYCMDEYAEMREVDPEMIRVCEPLMLEQVDCTFATSVALWRSKKTKNYETVYLPQGVDFTHFQHLGACPEALRRIPRPIIGFQGILGERIDLALLEKILQRFPQASLVTVGRREVDIARLRRYPNFHAFDPVPYAQLPAWAGRFDIGLVAYVKDGHTDSVNPLKLLEYLAMGQPVVAVDLPELALHREFIEIAPDHETYLAHLDTLIRRYPFAAAERERLKSYAAEHAWERRAARFLEVCDMLLRRKKERASLGKEVQAQAPAFMETRALNSDLVLPMRMKP